MILCFFVNERDVIKKSLELLEAHDAASVEEVLQLLVESTVSGNIAPASVGESGSYSGLPTS